jgi:hypothetical protein
MEGPEPPILSDIRELAYLSASSALGLLSAFSALLGNIEKPLSPRVIAAYLIAGALVSLGITMFLVAQYGFSYFLLGVSIFAGYKAFDTLSMIGVAISTLVQRFINNKP